MGAFKRFMEFCGFICDEDDEVEYSPMKIGRFIEAEELNYSLNKVVAIAFPGKNSASLFRYGAKEFVGVDGTIWLARGYWPLFDTCEDERSMLNSAEYNMKNYGRDWRAYEVSIPNEVRELGVAI